LVKRQKYFILLRKIDGEIDWKLKLMNFFELEEYKRSLLQSSTYVDAFFLDEKFMDSILKMWQNKEGWNKVENNIEKLISN